MKCDICGKQTDDNYLVCSRCFERIICYDELRQQLAIYKRAFELACIKFEENDKAFLLKSKWKSKEQHQKELLDQAKKELEEQK